MLLTSACLMPLYFALKHAPSPYSRCHLLP
jgi:hypothetical protein